MDEVRKEKELDLIKNEIAPEKEGIVKELI